MIVDNHLLFHEAIIDELERYDDMHVLGKAGNIQHAIERACQLKPDIVLVDDDLPDGNGLDAARSILAECPEAQIIILTSQVEDDYLLEAVRIGVKGCLLKTTPASKLVAAVRGMMRGEAPLSREMTARLIAQVARQEPNQLLDPDSRLNELTSREMQVLVEIAQGLSNHEIALKLVVSENTVRNHVHKILEKLDLRSRREAGVLARRCGLLSSRGHKV